MDKIKAAFSKLSTPLEWVAGKVSAYPKGFLITAVVLIVLARFL